LCTAANPDRSGDAADEYLRYLPTPDGWVLQVGVVGWASAHEPTLIWKTLRSWRRQPSVESRARAKAAALKRFFRTCVHCGKLCNLGHMHDRETCQGCAERLFDVQY
jgi:hypothetical protein